MSPLPHGIQLGRRARRQLSPALRSAGRSVLDTIGVSQATIERFRARGRPPLGPTLVEILKVEPTAFESGHLKAAQIDAPRAGGRNSVHAFDIAGWVLSRNMPVVGIEVLHGRNVLRRVPLRVPRPEIARRYPEANQAQPLGFNATIGVLGLPSDIQLTVQAAFEDDTRAPFATIQGRRTLLSSAFEPTLQPLLLTSLGRSGTTWMMRLLAQHPGIVALRQHPYEYRFARYWLHMLKVLSEPADHMHSAQPANFFRDRHWVGHNPYYSGLVRRFPRLHIWFGHTYIEILASFRHHCIDDCYQEVARSQKQPQATYFVEKHHPDGISALAWELYPQGREIFLVRDFRDMVSSILAFNAKQGKVSFGRQHVQDDESYIRDHLGTSLKHLLATWESRSNRAHLVRYEDLVLHPNETLRVLLEYLGLDSRSVTVEGMVRGASRETDESLHHQTSESPSASIGRWRRDLDPALQEVCQHALGDVLLAFGYAV